MKKTLVLAAAFAAAALMSTAAIATASPAHYDPGSFPAASTSKTSKSSASFSVTKAEPGAVQAVAVKDLNPVSIIQLASKDLNGGGSSSSPVHVGGHGPGGGDPNEHPERFAVRQGEGMGYARSRGGDGADGSFGLRS